MRMQRIGFIIGVCSPFVFAVIIALIVSSQQPSSMRTVRRVAPAAYSQNYLAMFQSLQREKLVDVSRQVAVLEDFGVDLERQFRVNPVSHVKQAAQQLNPAEARVALRRLVLLDIQNALDFAHEQLTTSPDTALDAVQAARVNYQVLSMFSEAHNTPLDRSIKETFLETVMAVKTEAATPALLRAYSDDIGTKLRQIFPDLRVAMGAQKSRFN